MLKFLVVSSLLFVVVSTLPPPVDPRADPIVSIAVGQLRGKEVYDDPPGSSENYLAFEGIPYAEPPTGDLRFRAPIPHAGWDGIRNAQKPGNSCVQFDSSYKFLGDEDCLFLNVYTPSLEGKRPVMFWVHGGAFLNGLGDFSKWGPSHLIKEDVVVVTINYRLGIFGFLSTNDSFAPGNYGMKDMVEALRWVRRNIEAFSGDPDDVTIFGESAGGVSVHMLVLSPLTKGFFKRAIMQSGTALAHWAIQPDPNSFAIKTAQNLGIDTSSSEAILRGLRAASVSDLQNQVPTQKNLSVPYGLKPWRFTPTVDAPDSLELRFMPQMPIEMIRTRSFNDVPLIIGRNSDESLWNILEPAGSIDKMNADPNTWIPVYWNVTRRSPEAQEVIQSYRDTYFGGGDIEDIYNYTKFHTDHQFAWHVYKTAQLHVQIQSNPVYFYDFAFDGVLNYSKRTKGLGEYPGAMHGDDLYYIWLDPKAVPVLPEDPAYIVRSRMVKMWTNFAKSGNPTPEVNSLLRVQWPKATSSRMDYLRIDKELSIQHKPYEERMEMWRKYDSKYGP